MTSYNTIETHYQEVINHLKPNGLNSVDFLGLNIDEKEKIEFKIYYPPKKRVTAKSAENEIEKYIISNNMYKLTCETYSPQGSRRYIVLKNKSKEKISTLLEVISQHYPWFSNYTNQIMGISEMMVTDLSNVDNSNNPVKSNLATSSAVHMIGFKRSLSNNESAINIEWLTRKVLSDDKNSSKYLYDDQYFLSFLQSVDDESICSLCRDAYKSFSKEIESEELHVWLFASDFYEKSKSKHKVYLKCTDKTDEKIIFSKIYSWINAENSLRCNSFGIENRLDTFYDDIDLFIEKHSELTLYGFALGLCGDKKMVNLYFIQE